MNGYRHIVVPVDFSPASAHALEIARVIASRHMATLEIVHAWEPPGFLPADALFEVPGQPSRTVRDIAVAHAQSAMEPLLLTLAKHRDLRMQHRIEEGAPADVILNVARESQADLIVMGTHGRRGLARAFAGSVAERVVRLAPCAVLTTRAPDPPPPGEDFDGDAAMETPAEKPTEKLRASQAPGHGHVSFELRRILVATDFTEAARLALAHAVVLADSFRAPIDVLHTWEVPIPLVSDTLVNGPGMPQQTVQAYLRADAESAMRAWLASSPAPDSMPMNTLLEPGPASEQILSLASRGEYDLLVMATHGQKGLSRWLRGSTTEKVVRMAHLPVLAVPPDAHDESPSPEATPTGAHTEV